MGKLFKSFLFKLAHDKTFRITLIIGVAMSILLSIIYLLIDLMIFSGGEDGFHHYFSNGTNLFISSLSPSQNFGISIPVNLITFTVLEFTHGTIRNKIIAGNSKFKIYMALFFSGLVFALALLLIYVGLSTLIGTIMGGFDVNGYSLSATSLESLMVKMSGEYLIKLSVVTLLTYVSLTAFTIFISTLTRNIGGSIPLVLIAIIGLSVISQIVGSINALAGEDADETLMMITKVLQIVNPFHAMNASEVKIVGSDMVRTMEDKTFISGIVNNLVYTALFTGLGALIFSKRDVK